MDVDIFKDIVAPVIGGLGLFMLGLEFMASGIQALSVNKLRDWLAKVAGTPTKGVLAGTIITGIIQSSTAMTVMTVGLVNAGVIALRPAISVIMGANVGTTLGNGLIALPLGPLGLFFGGIFALVYTFAKAERVRNIALASLGFALIFYGLNLMTGGLRPLRDMPEVMSVISSLDATTFPGVLLCALIAAFITAMIHSSSGTIGIVMGLGASGILPWQTAIAFAIGADLGTTITSWMASLNLSKNAKRAAYAHIGFNVIGVVVVLALFFPAIELLKLVMNFFGGDPGVPVLVDGKETYPLVPVAVGIFSIAFNMLNVALLFPFVGTFERVLLRIGHSAADERDDFSVPRFIQRTPAADFATAAAAAHFETERMLRGVAQFLGIARRAPQLPADPAKHHAALDVLQRELRDYAQGLIRAELARDQLALAASMSSEIDLAGGLSNRLNKVAQLAQSGGQGAEAQAIAIEALSRIETALAPIQPEGEAVAPLLPVGWPPRPATDDLRLRALDPDAALGPGERSNILALLNSAERVLDLIERIAAERRAAPRHFGPAPLAAASAKDVAPPAAAYAT